MSRSRDSPLTRIVSGKSPMARHSPAFTKRSASEVRLEGTTICEVRAVAHGNDGWAYGGGVMLNLQNAILYGFGSAIAISSYAWEASTAKKHVPPFFHGYNALAALLVVFQVF